MGAVRPAADAELEVRLLGPLEVARGMDTLPLGGPKPRALLAALALEAGRVVSVDRLIENLWPGEAPGTAAHAVQVYVSQLRKALGRVIARRPPGYLLELDAERVDVHRFGRLAEEGRTALQADNPEAAEGALRAALGLWRGPALADFLYEPFVQADIARLEELRLVTLEERIEADLALGRHVELVAELEALVQSEPLRERPRRQLMLALYRSGRQADALAAYRAARDALVEELGIEPGPELKHLEAAILRQDDSLLLPETAAERPVMQFRRLVTILFVDVVESMALAERLDAEALGRVLTRYFETVSGVLAQHGGTVEKFAGDAVMAIFGVPVSHEDDALRAARAALEIRAGVAALNEQLSREHGIVLETRIGVESGEVVASPTGSRQRLVTGEAVGIAAGLEQSAAANEIVVGEHTARLIDHAAMLEPLGELEIKGKREPVRAYGLVELVAAAPAFERRLDAPLVGRKRELASLRKALKRVIEDRSARSVLVVGPPGVGKSRLAAELVFRAKGVSALFGRCLSYGDGITYWPLREIVRGAEPSEERDAVLGALEAETPPPAPEIAWLFRLFCESFARERPLALVLDDLHWAEPTFLELVEQVSERGKGPILVVCLAREELLEERPDFLEERENVERIVLEGLSPGETVVLLDGLGGAVLESDQRSRIVDGAEGNPFFLEQLLALAMEGGLAEGAMPATVQALLAARLDRLGPGERGVLERGAVIGKEFAAADVAALLDPAAAPTVPAHLATLSVRGFVRPAGDDSCRFRHVLVQEAVYRAAPKRLRAELHERFADRLDGNTPELPELDELTGYHLEQAYRLRTELGVSDRRTERLAEDAGRRLGEAGMRAFRRADMSATTTLLTRATTLLPTDEPLRRGLLCDLGLTRHAMRDADGAVDALEEAIISARDAGDRRVEWWARIELEGIRLQRESRKTADDLLAATAAGIPILEAAGDDRAVGRAYVLAGWVRGGHRGDHTAWAEAAQRALTSYRAASWSTSTCLGQLAAALYWGPTPVPEAIVRLERLQSSEVSDRAGAAYVLAFLGGLEAQLQDFDRARALIASAQSTLDELGLDAAALAYCAPVLADVELLAGDAGTAEFVLRELCDELTRGGEVSYLAGRASDLAEALLLQGLVEQADDWTHVAEHHAAPDDVNAQMMWRPIRARIEAARGDVDGAIGLAREAVELAERTDHLNARAKAYRDLGMVLQMAGEADAAADAWRESVRLYELKGNLAAVARNSALRQACLLV